MHIFVSEKWVQTPLPTAAYMIPRKLIAARRNGCVDGVPDGNGVLSGFLGCI